MSPEELIALSEGVKFLTPVSATISSEQATLLLKYVEFLSKWSAKMSLVSSTDPDRIINEHILDAWAAFHLVPRETAYLDIGSGAGLPGVVFSILAPQSKVVLLEPRAKRIEFLKEVRRSLRLANVEIVEARLEEWKGDFSEVSAVQRAVGQEGENYKLIKTQYAKPTFSVLVSESWYGASDLPPPRELSYELPSGIRHKVSCFT